LSRVAAFDSHWSCPVLVCRTASRRPGYCYCLKRTSQTAAQTAELTSACSSRWIRPCFSQSVGRSRKDRSRPGMPLEPTPGSFPFGSLPLGFSDHAFNAPTQQLRRPLVRPIFGPVWSPHFASRNPRTEGRQALAPLPQPAGGVISSGALLGATGGTQTHSRRTGSKLGRLRYARQGLVRVPESNTKYGGLGGITGGSPAPVIEPSISESTRNPKQKNCPHGCEFPPAPAVHRRGIFSPPRH
jgi:hypothetical protein